MNLLSDVIELRERDRTSTIAWYNLYKLLCEVAQDIKKLEDENKDLREVIYHHGKRIQKLEEKNNEKEMQLHH